MCVLKKLSIYIRFILIVLKAVFNICIICAVSLQVEIPALVSAQMKNFFTRLSLRNFCSNFSLKLEIGCFFEEFLIL